MSCIQVLALSITRAHDNEVYRWSASGMWVTVSDGMCGYWYVADRWRLNVRRRWSVAATSTFSSTWTASVPADNIVLCTSEDQRLPPTRA